MKKAFKQRLEYLQNTAHSTRSSSNDITEMNRHLDETERDLLKVIHIVLSDVHRWESGHSFLLSMSNALKNSL